MPPRESIQRLIRESAMTSGGESDANSTVGSSPAGRHAVAAPTRIVPTAIPRKLLAAWRASIIVLLP